MTDELAELRRVYTDAAVASIKPPETLYQPNDAALLAVARYSAEKQRDSQIDHDDTVAPLWVDKK